MVDISNSQASLELYNKAKYVAEKLTNNNLIVNQNLLCFMQEHSRKNNTDDSFHVYDIAKIVERYLVWKKFLPNVMPFYAIKANNDPVVVSVLSSLGLGFDCASMKEINLALSAKTDPLKIIFAHTRKSEKDILMASKLGVELMTFDSMEELIKIQQVAPNTKLILRIKTKDKESLNPLSSKFGASISHARVLLKFAFINNIQVKGISFHIGSNAKDAYQYQQSLNDALDLIELAKAKYRMVLDIIDLGGGWPGTNDILFEKMANIVNCWYCQSGTSNISLIAEPGRFFSSQIMHSAMRIIGKDIINRNQQKHIFYYLANGAYGLYLSSFYYRHELTKLHSEGWNFRPLFPKTGELISSTLWGATCDSGDFICKKWPIHEMDSGEYIYSDNIGAYTISTQTHFNGIEPSKAYYLWTK